MPPAWAQDSYEIATPFLCIAVKSSILIAMSQEKHILNRLLLLDMPSAEGQKTVQLVFGYLALGQGPLILGTPSKTEETGPSLKHSIKDLGVGGSGAPV